MAYRDKHDRRYDRTYLILGGYEVCSSWLGYVLYDDTAAAPGSPVGVPVSEFIEFCSFAYRSIGLPLPCIRLTNRFLLDECGQPMTQSQIRKVLGDQLDDGKSPRLIVEVGDVHFPLPCDYSVDVIEDGVSSTNLLKRLDRFVNVHNDEFAISKIREGRETMRKLANTSEWERELRLISVYERRFKDIFAAEPLHIGELIIRSKLHRLF